MITIFPMPEAVKAQRGGQYTYCENLKKLFKGDDEIIYLNYNQPKGKNIPILNKIWFSWKDLYRKIRDSNCDIVHINGYLGPSTWQEFIVARLTNKKIIYSPHFHPFKYLRRPLLGRLFFYFMLLPTLPFASVIFTIGDADYNFFKRLHKRVVKVPHHFEMTAKEHKTHKKENMILFVGRNESNKGMEYLYSIPSKYEVHCVTGGELERKDFIQHTMISAEELSKLYSQASLVVVPSRYEAFSLVALEAFSHDTPVLMSSNVKIADYLINESGFAIFRYGDKQDFIDKIETVIGMPVDRETILGKFSPAIIKNQYKRSISKL